MTPPALQSAPAAEELGRFHPEDTEKDYGIGIVQTEDIEGLVLAERDPESFIEDTINPANSVAAALRSETNNKNVHIEISTFDDKTPGSVVRSFTLNAIKTLSQTEEGEAPKRVEVGISTEALEDEKTSATFGHLGFTALNADKFQATLVKSAETEDLSKVEAQENTAAILEMAQHAQEEPQLQVAA